jgi:N-methylhydantoinase B/oxoprolinase/acetone carboxylase alpha subunit
MTEYNELLAKLAAQRLTLATAKELRTVMIQNFEESTTYQAIQANINNAAQQVDELSDQLRELALADYKATGSKKPHPVMGIRVSLKLTYDPAVALDWAKTEMPAALMLDTKTFEAFVKSANTVPLTFVDYQQIPSATIATDLSEYLKETK